jgi:hypothetical protein
MNPTTDDSARDCQLEAILHAYLQAVDAGQSPDRDTLLRQHPEFASKLAAFFADQDEVWQLARGMVEPGARAQPAKEAATLPPAEPAAPSPDTQVHYFGDYELLDEIARGGMGVVYKARQISLNRSVALKMIIAGQLASPADVQRFYAEAEAAANLDHPNIVPIYEVGEHDGQHYFSMKLIDGGSLAAALGAARTHTASKAAAKLIATVARAVHYAHQRGILHRDLKPANILLARSDPIHGIRLGGSPDASGHCEPHVTDFGLARRLDAAGSLSPSGAIIGTPSYMSPEQARASKGLTTATDVYSLGAILYELLTGRPPFRTDNVLETLKQVVEQELQPVRALNRRVDRDLETICLKCLRKEPGERCGSAEALADDLERWLRGEPIQARRVGTVKRVLKWARRKPAIAVLTTAILAAVVLGVAGMAWQWQRAERHLKDAEAARDQAKSAVKDAKQTLTYSNLEEAEHLPLLHQRFPAWAEKVEFWHVDDAPEVLALIECEVMDLAARLIGGGDSTLGVQPVRRSNRVLQKGVRCRRSWPPARAGRHADHARTDSYWEELSLPCRRLSRILWRQVRNGHSAERHSRHHSPLCRELRCRHQAGSGRRRNGDHAGCRHVLGRSLWNGDRSLRP